MAIFLGMLNCMVSGAFICQPVPALQERSSAWMQLVSAPLQIHPLAWLAGEMHAFFAFVAITTSCAGTAVRHTSHSSKCSTDPIETCAFLALVVALQTVMPLMATERDVYYRERAIMMYSPFPYSAAITLSEIPYILAQTVIMVCITYWMVSCRLLKNGLRCL